MLFQRVRHNFMPNALMRTHQKIGLFAFIQAASKSIFNSCDQLRCLFGDGIAKN